ncbi:DUF4245 domain-containing protein [Blastococcus sp. CT_GayMR16]|uniref:DUF4245 domain-containing protein n=1 Tax=Blastococcus sp. CT_GayMR16 TaxID=2559607 RepID=UPI001072F502|nr:DUF4245 domain-containing protein [Blastococcus sp. CT_GayMR16]TFV83291.1 DUF4245 domain-containing protein [Blastococcus sp. CT_GayMR16]
MTGVGPTSQRPSQPQDDAAPAPAESPAIQRAARMNAANMVRSLLPLVVICLVIVAWTTFRQSPDVDPIREIDPATTVDLAAARASYPIQYPQGLGKDYVPTSARTDAGAASEGDPVTLEIGYVTPSEEFAGFVVSDDRRAEPLAKVLDGAQAQGTVDVEGRSWTRSTAQNGETVLSREDGVAIVAVSGSASDEELETVAAAVEPYSA